MKSLAGCRLNAGTQTTVGLGEERSHPAGMMRGVAPLLAAPLRAPLLLTALLTGLWGAAAPLADTPLADGTRTSTPGDSMTTAPLTDGRPGAPFTCATAPLPL